jgi:hypothetical protein
MKRGRPVRIHGNISVSAAHNLHEYQRAWELWRPGVYHQVDLIPDAVVAEHPRSAKVIQTFSGGVDSTFTLISNKYLHKERGGYDIAGAVLVHGFDVSYENTSDFGKLVRRLRRTLDNAGVELKIVRTNSRAVKVQSWMDSVPAQLSACLHQFSDHYGKALISSTEPYDAAYGVPISSNPITDHLLSGDLMTIIHDGASYSRTEKVEAISKFPFYVDQLKVCWEGRNQYENCGECEKCLRTRLNFAAVGNNEPSCFRGPFDKKMLRKLQARGAIELLELEGILTYMRQRGLSYPWVNGLRRRIVLLRLAIPVKTAIRWPKLKALARSALQTLRGTRRFRQPPTVVN